MMNNVPPDMGLPSKITYKGESRHLHTSLVIDWCIYDQRC